MTADIESLVLEHLRAMRGDIGEIKQRLDRMDLRLSVLEQTTGSLLTLGASDRDAMASLAKRIERIEQRLELRDAAH